MERLKHILAVAAITVLAACTLEDSGNGDLDGYWHLVAIDTLATDGIIDTSNERVFWAVQGKLIKFMDMDSRARAVLGHFTHTGDSLFIADTYYYDSRYEDDPEVHSVDSLRVFGLNGFHEEFAVETLSSSRMQLCSDVLRLRFKKQ